MKPMAERVRELAARFPHHSQDAEEEARLILKTLPKGDIYFHGSNGRPCPCAGCVAYAEAKLAEMGHLFPEFKRRAA